MPTRNRTTTRNHLSIGEVLSLLQEEFPDVTISKIRFLESQGLLNPERTPSGYRKFYESDIEQLRWILLQQKENFLPLKVIKDRLAAGEPYSEPSANELPGDPAASPAEPESTAELQPQPTAASDPERPPARVPEAIAPQLDLAGVGSSVSLSVDEFTAATGLSGRQVAELEQYGLLSSHRLGADAFYSEDAVIVGRMAARFAAHGVEPRLLRMFKVSAEREAGFYEQLLLPRLLQRRPGARQEVLDDLDDLVELADQLHGTILRRLLRESFHAR